MNVQRFPCLASAAAVVAMLGACSGAQPPLTATPPSPQWESSRSARRACAKAPPGRAECLVLVLNAGMQPDVSGWGPPDIQAAYDLPSSTKGSGEIVAVVDAYDNPNVASDLAKYRAQYGLGTASFYKYNQTGQQSNYPAGSTGWGVEIDLDAEMVSASCPLCTIYLIEANSADSSDLQAAEKEAVKLGAHIVSNSWICYGSDNCVDKSDFDAPGVIYLASAGDDGSNKGGAPMAFDSVAAIGGTVLSKNGSQYSEMPWSSSGGGCLTGVKRPKWQHDTFCKYRSANDASAVASGVAEYDSYGEAGWISVGGTSVSAPILAGVFGLAGNPTKQDGGRTFWQKAHHQYLHDICGGSCLSSTYSYAGGWGSPDGIGAF